MADALSADVSVRLGPDDIGGDPAALRRRDGSSVFAVAGSQLYTCTAVLDAERRVVDAALRDDGRTVDDGAIEIAMLEATAYGVNLTEDQQRLVHDLATSGARVQLALAPAGSGKTTALGVLARAWGDSGGSIVGLAPSAVAAKELRQSLGVQTETVAKLLHSLSEPFPPEWVRGIDASTLFLVDEAAMVGTLDLDRVIAVAMEHGASVRLVGDDRQLASIKTGGVLRDIAETAGAVRMDSVVRFADPVEGLASLALRDGDPGALGYYLAHGRVHSGDAGSALDQAYRAWSADRAAGRDSVLLALTRDQVQQLNLRARDDRLIEAGGDAPTARLHDGTEASAGELIITLRNERRLPLTASDWVKNGDRFRVTAVADNGDLRVTHLDTRRRITLPARFVRDHVELGYASTVHTAQGRTADTSHVVITGRETRDTLFVAMTRGRLANHVYVAAGSSGDPELATTPDAVIPPTSVEMLERVIAHDGIRRSASTQLREISSPSPRLATAVARYEDALSRSGLPSGDGPGPLPWLPAPPQRPAGDEWGDYLSARADLVRDVAKEVVAVGLDRTSWSSSLTGADIPLSEEVSVWRAAQGVPIGDDRETGERREEAITYQIDLAKRVAAVLGEQARTTSRWTALVDAIDPRVTGAPGWILLDEDLTRAANAGYDVPTNLPRLIGTAMSGRYGVHDVRYDLYAECKAARPPAVHRPAEPAPSDRADRARRDDDNELLRAIQTRATINRGGPAR